MRRIALTNKKVRGVRRRLRSLAKWAASFASSFPSGLTEADRYVNYKIPVLQSLVEGAQTSREIQRECAQHMIEACSNLVSAKPATASSLRVVATICLPDMFSSEICIYSDEAYFQSKVRTNVDASGSVTALGDRRLTKEWGLVLPAGMQESGVAVVSSGSDSSDEQYVSEHWFFGELR